jgi:hypothetical protein
MTRTTWRGALRCVNLAAMVDAASTAAALAPETTVEVDLRHGWGSTGLKQYSGIIREEFLPELEGRRAIEVYKEMGDNDYASSTILYTIDKLCRRVSWRADPASSAWFDREAAEFLEGNLDDMEDTWTDTVSEFLSMLQYGWSLHSMVFKRRMGYWGGGHDASRNSRFSDGRVGLLGLPIRAQDTITRWDMDTRGRILGAVQLAPPLWRDVYLDMNRCLLMRTTKHKNNPEGRSILRGAYRPWYMKRGIENIEAVGVERNAAGLPMAFVPPNILKPKTAADREIFAAVRRLVTGVRQDSEGGLIFPMVRDASGNLVYDFKLLNSGGPGPDCDKIIQRYDHRITMSVLADFLLLGQGSGAQGSWAMHSDKTQLFAEAIGVYLDIIAETLNRQLVPLLFRMNTFRYSDYPRLVPGPVAKRDLKELGALLQALSAAGMPLFPNPALEAFIYKEADLPAPVDLEAPMSGEEEVQPQETITPETVTELNDPPQPSRSIGASGPDVDAQRRAAQVFPGRI